MKQIELNEIIYKKGISGDYNSIDGVTSLIVVPQKHCIVVFIERYKPRIDGITYEILKTFEVNQREQAIEYTYEYFKEQTR